MLKDQLLKHSKKWDRSGVLIAGLCLIHCLAVPVLVIALPSLYFLATPWAEALVLFLGIFVGSISFFTSYKNHRIHYPMILGAIGVILLTYSLFGHDDHQHDFTLASFNLWTLFGGLFLITGHLWNMHACHCFCDTSCSHEEHDEHTHYDHKHNESHKHQSL